MRSQANAEKRKQSLREKGIIGNIDPVGNQ